MAQTPYRPLDPHRFASRVPINEFYDVETNELVQQFRLRGLWGRGIEERRVKYVPPRGNELSTRATRPGINSVATEPRPITILAENQPIPIIYGTVTLGPLVITRRLDAVGNLVLLLVWCLGEIDAIEEVKLNTSPVPISVQLTHYLGTTIQEIDPTLGALIPGYTDDLIHDADGTPVGIAYTVAVVPPNTSEGFPEFVARIRGKKVYDPRDGGQAENDPSTWLHSQNPSLILADFERNSVYGLGRKVDNASVIVAANENDGLVGGLPRRTLNLQLREPATRASWRAVLMEYAAVFIVREGDTTRFIPDRPAASVASISDADVVSGSMSMKRAGTRNRPTAMRVTYTDITGDLPIERTVEVCAAGVKNQMIPRRESNISLPGINNYAEANRHAIERLNYFQLTDLTIEWVAFDDSLALLNGEVISVTHKRGLNNRQFRLVSSSAEDAGRWRHRAIEYNVEQYSNDPSAAPGVSDTDLPDPSIVPPVTGLQISETVAQLQTGIYFSRITASWMPASYAYSFDYRVVVLEQASGTVLQDTKGRSTEINTAAVQEGIAYEVRVSVIAALGFEGPQSIANITAQGKLLVPSDVPQFTATRTGANVLDLQWLPAIDLDIRYYEIRVGAGTWETAVFVDRIDAFRTPVVVPTTNNITYTYQIKAIDSIGQYSVNATTVSKTMTVPSDVVGFTGDALGGNVRLQWQKATGFVSAYGIRYAAQGGGFTWETATPLDEISALAYFTRAIPTGAFTFFIKALDASGGESANAATINLNVVIDTNRFFIDTRFYTTHQSLTNMYAYQLEPKDPATYYITDDGVTWDAKFPALFDTYSNILFTYHSVTNSELLTETIDFDVLLSGAWANNLDNITEITGTAASTLELSTDAVVWDPYPANISNNAEAQYSRLSIKGDAGDTLLVKLPGLSTNINVETFEEVGFDVTTSGGSHRLITLQRDYIRAKAIVLTIEGNDAYTITYQNLTLGSPTTFEVLGFNTRNGNRVAANFSWEFKGV